jgi:hypothetical protein
MCGEGEREGQEFILTKGAIAFDPANKGSSAKSTSFQIYLPPELLASKNVALSYIF